MAHSSALPKISIVTPSYNQAAFIERTIQSVLSQHYPNLEYIVIDGDSRDGTLQILESYKDQLRYISEPDKGQSDAINKGLRMTTGDIVAYLNSDDILQPESLMAVGTFFANHPDTQWVSGYSKIINENDEEISSYIRLYKNFLLRHYTTNMLLVINFISQMSTFWRRSAMERVGEFSVDQHLVMDYDYWLRLQVCGQPGIIRRDLSCFRVHAGAKSSLRFVEQFRQSYLVASRYIKQPWLRFASRLHNWLVVQVYRVGISK